MIKFAGGCIVGILVVGIYAPFHWTNTDSYKLGQEVQKVIDVCEEKLPRNENCTFLIVSERDAPESKLIYEEKSK